MLGIMDKRWTMYILVVVVVQAKGKWESLRMKLHLKILFLRKSNRWN